MPSTTLIPVGSLVTASVFLTGVVIGNAYYQKKQFYPSVVYITKSNLSMAAIYVLAFTMVILLGQFLKKVFFGQLRAAEFEHLIERSFYAVTETCLAFTLFRDDFTPKFVALFTVLLFLKAFHWLADSRVDFMERSPVITLLFHIRVFSLVVLLGNLDLVLIHHAYHSTITKGATVQLAFGFEYAILFTVACNILVKYVCHTIDLRSENPWENKAVYLLYTELIVGFVKVLLYGVFLFIMIKIHSFPLFIIRPMYLTIRSFKKALNDVIQSRRAISNMNNLYPNATAEELAAVDNVCIICREEMTTGAKKLPCGHIFHTSCLRSWFQRQQTCPTCRMDILRQQPPTSTPVAPQNQPQVNVPQPEAAAQPQQPQPGNAFNIPGMQMPPFPFPTMPVLPPQMNATASASSSTTTNTTTGASSTTTGTNAIPTPPFNFMPPFFPMMQFSIPMPTAPPNYSGMTDEELAELEGRERRNVEARIQALRNIQTLLDAAVIQMNQYSSIMTALDRESASANATSPSPSSSSIPTSTNNTNITVSASDSTTVSASQSCTTTSATTTVESSNSEVKVATSIDNPTSSTTEATSSGLSNSPSQRIDDDADEVRRRRLERFSRETSSS